MIQTPMAGPAGATPVAPAPVFQPIPIPADRYSPLGFGAATLTIASAATIGANMVDVHNGAMTPPQAVANGIAKGVLATVILSVTPKKSTLDVLVTAAALAGAGYAVDRMMKKRKGETP